MPQRGIFLTGIEDSDPAIRGTRRNQLKEVHASKIQRGEAHQSGFWSEATDFYMYYKYKDRLEKIRDLGLTWLRFGPPYSQVHLGRDRYDFAFVDKVVKECDELGITVMANLLHFGLPDWLYERNAESPHFQNPYFPIEFARYASTFAKRYPQIRYYTVINEPYVTAHCSARLGHWNEARKSDWHDDRDFVRAAANIAKAAILARKATQSVWLEESREDEPLFIQNESFELAHAAPGSNREAEAHRFNLRRFALLDLIFGHQDEAMKAYLIDQGMTETQYEWFMQHGSMKQSILGIDHYPTCIHTFEADRTVDHDASQPYRLFELIEEYWARYPLPLLHTEVNGWPEHAVTLCQKTYDALTKLRSEGYPVLGMGWYGDELQVGWPVAMPGPDARLGNPVGLFHKDVVQPVGELFSELAEQGMPPFDHRDVKLRMSTRQVSKTS